MRPRVLAACVRAMAERRSQPSARGEKKPAARRAATSRGHRSVGQSRRRARMNSRSRRARRMPEVGGHPTRGGVRWMRRGFENDAGVRAKFGAESLVRV